MSFLRDYAETQRFTLGRPVQVSVGTDGQRVVFLRTATGRDRSRCLWVHDVDVAAERLIVDPATLDADSTVSMSPDERARRERMRDSSTGIGVYATDRDARLAAFALEGALWVADLIDGGARRLPATEPVIDPRPSPDGSTIAYVHAGELHVAALDADGDRVLAEPDGPDVSWGLAEHVAAESMGRYRGFWWAPDGSAIVAARVDNSPLATWHLMDVTDPANAPITIRYPPAGTANADVSLWILGLDGSRREVVWDRKAYEYVTAVTWDATALLVVVQNRAQTSVRILTVDPETGATSLVREETDRCWVTIVPGVPAHTSSGALVWTADMGDTRRLLVGGVPVTPDGLQVHEILGVSGETVLFLASEDPTEAALWTFTAGGSPATAGSAGASAPDGSPAPGLLRISAEPGVHDGAIGGGTLVVASMTMTYAPARWAVHAPGRAPRDLVDRAETPSITPDVRFMLAGERDLRTAVLYPSGHVPGTRLPVLMDPYGGPAAQRVRHAQAAYLLSQWYADQGFIVVIADGRGTPGRGPAWERLIHLDSNDMRVEDQVEALHAAARAHPDMDLDRVGIRGWSAGGALAARAVLRRPDVFHAAAAGAAPADPRLYDTHWNERYYGHPDEHPEVYDAVALATYAADLHRPLLLVHGLRDDNVHSAHTMRLSAALFAAGRPHGVLPLPGASHMAPGADVTEALHELTARFLHDALAPVRWIP